jgi:hypothetical protein
MISKNLLTPSSKTALLIKQVVAAFCLVLLIDSPLMSATEINIGVNNTVNTGKIVGGNCVQGSNKLTTERMAVSSFTSIVVEGVFIVNVTCGEASAVTITADDNLHSLISGKVKGSVLHLDTTRSYCTSNSFVADISLPELASLSVDGSSDLTLECNRSVGGRLAVDLRGASTMKAVGMVSQLQATVQGSSELDAYQLTAETVTVTAGDAASVRLTATRSLTGQAEGASTVTYRGQPKTVTVSVADAGECSPDE